MAEKKAPAKKATAPKAAAKPAAKPAKAPVKDDKQVVGKYKIECVYGDLYQYTSFRCLPITASFFMRAGNTLLWPAVKAV